jgi:hypothetical protein
VDILKLHGYYKVKEMPPEFVNACGNLYLFCYLPHSTIFLPSSIFHLLLLASSFVSVLSLSLVFSNSPSLPSTRRNLALKEARYSSCKCFFGQDETFKRTRFTEKEIETGYRKAKDRESVFFRKGYHLDDQSPRGVALDPARGMHKDAIVGKWEGKKERGRVEGGGGRRRQRQC